MGKLSGKTAVITGGSTGIGLGTAKRFVAEGAKVFITGRRQAELDKAVKEIGDQVIAIRSDVANLADLDRLFAEVKGQVGKLDVLFANAGTGAVAPLGSISEEHYDREYERERHTLYCAEGIAVARGRRVNHSRGFYGDHHRQSGLQCLLRHEGGRSQFCTELDFGS